MNHPHRVQYFLLTLLLLALMMLKNRCETINRPEYKKSVAESQKILPEYQRVVQITHTNGDTETQNSYGPAWIKPQIGQSCAVLYDSVGVPFYIQDVSQIKTITK